MTILDRVFLGLTAIALLVFASFLIATMLGSTVLIEWLQSSDLHLDGGMVVLLTVLLAVYLLILISKRERQKFIVHQGELGQVRLSVNCLQGLLREVAGGLPGIEEAAVLVTDPKELKIRLDIRIFPDFHIPQLSKELQQTVRNFVENTVGLDVQNVEIVVHGVTESKPRLA
ncbi:MAG: alkaline shock response membrane anchor protein AmaP [Firmicutes bacterium]|nr:alkaline shock response membrane anchor protein AmaP [Bacillota bacterium]